MIACCKVGAILVTINPLYTASELVQALDNVGASFLLITRTLGSRDFSSHIAAVKIPLLTMDSYDELMTGEGMTPVDVSVHDIVNIQFTSGTTGSPKAASLTHHNILNNGFYVGENMALTQDDVLCNPMPLFHCFGL